MALTFGSMDQQVQQQADAFSDNPAALQQRYQKSQQLLDLLALQKLKSDKEAAAREMQMQMEQRPQTIAQQREAEVMGLTKDELAKQMGGIMAQRQDNPPDNVWLWSLPCVILERKVLLLSVPTIWSIWLKVAL